MDFDLFGRASGLLARHPGALRRRQESARSPREWGGILAATPTMIAAAAMAEMGHSFRADRCPRSTAGWPARHGLAWAIVFEEDLARLDGRWRASSAATRCSCWMIARYCTHGQKVRFTAPELVPRGAPFRTGIGLTRAGVPAGDLPGPSDDPPAPPWMAIPTLY